MNEKIHLPDRKGLELISGILSYNSRIPITILTGYSDLTTAKKGCKSVFMIT
jgi:ActR/RegA family two-component response regulator